MFEAYSIENRYNKLLKAIGEKSNYAVLLMNDHNVRYFSGFTGDSTYCLMLGNNKYVITDSRYTLQCSEQCVGFTVVDSKNNLIEATADILHKAGIKTLFVESDMSASTWIKINETMGCDEYLFVDKYVQDIRVIKDIVEIEASTKAAAIASEALESILPIIKPGVSEHTIAVELEYQMKLRGASSVSFDTIVASGKRSALPHGVASNKIVEAGDPVTIDFGCIYNGYCSDCTRTFFVGTPDPKMVEIYNIVKEAQETAQAAIREGVTGKYVDSIARDIITKAGYGPRFGHGTGHGTGLEIHESPRLSPHPVADKPLTTGMIVTCEPGIYIDGFGGVRIEDQSIVKPDGSIILSTFTKELIVL